MQVLYNNDDTIGKKIQLNSLQLFYRVFSIDCRRNRYQAKILNCLFHYVQVLLSTKRELENYIKIS